MIIKSNTKNYNVIFQDKVDFVNQLFEYPNSQFVIDKKVYDLYQPYFAAIPEKQLILIEAIEENKVMDTVLAICEEMTKISAKRNAVLVSIGGGIIQDITGFVANILYRGIKWIFVPTTLLASSDSCIGGKTSLNYKGFKNLFGTFYPPDEIHICPEFFQTLSKQDFNSGLGEVIKFNIMAGREVLAKLQERIEPLVNRQNDVVVDCVKTSLSFKKEFIEVDEFDQGERIKLNFAHTFGHAIETVSNYKIPHGTAVAIGMIMANSVSVKRGILSPETAELSESLLLKVIDIDFSYMDASIDKFILAMQKDKKQVGNSLTLVLMTDVPKDLKIVHDVTVDEIESAFHHFSKLYKGTKHAN